MPRKGYKPSGYNVKMPDPETLVAEHARFGRLYAHLAQVPLYANVRIICPGLIGTKRASFWLGWLIEEKRWAWNTDKTLLPADALAWAGERIAEIYPSVEEAAGMTRAEIDALKAEQAAKRAAHERRKS